MELSQNFVIGIDGGGSKTNAVLCDSQRNIIASCSSSSGNVRDLQLTYNSIDSLIQQLITTYHLSPTINIGAGVAGFSNTVNSDALMTMMLKKYPNFKLTTDAHIALLAEYGNNDGVILICGTGVIASKVINGVYRNILGGWGFPHDDVAGGAHLGLQITQLLCHAFDSLISWSDMLLAAKQQIGGDQLACKKWLCNAQVKQLATLAPLLFEYYNTDFNAKVILDLNIQHLVKIIRRINELTNKLPITITGGLAKQYYVYLKPLYPQLQLSLSTTKIAIGGTYLFCL